MTVVVITGTPGAGKTTVLSGALEKLKGKFEIVNYGDEMMKAAEKKKIVKHRDEMRKLAPETQKKIQKLAAESIAKKAKKTSIIVDTHCCIKTPKGYLPGLPKWVIEKIKPNQIVLVEADPNEIAARRAKDETRVRDAEYASELEEHQMMNRAMAMAYAMYTGATVKIVKNNDNKLDEAVENLRRALSE